MMKRIITTSQGGVAIRKITKNGNSLAICLPKEALEKRGFRLGDELIIAWNGGIKMYPLQDMRTPSITEKNDE
jgi:antitoxin component of MazEF toxin-antitoxin module